MFHKVKYNTTQNKQTKNNKNNDTQGTQIKLEEKTFQQKIM